MAREQHQPLIDENLSRFANNVIHYGAVFEEDKLLCDEFISDQSRYEFPNIHHAVENIMSQGLAKSIDNDIQNGDNNRTSDEFFCTFEQNITELVPEYEGYPLA